MSDLQQARYFPSDALSLTEVIPGASMWAVSLKNTQLTYFEVEAQSHFEMHQHPSEQITMVLEGTLYFDLGNEIFPVKPGEVIAIPSNVPHAVFTETEAVKAIDAWSPVMEKYQGDGN